MRIQIPAYRSPCRSRRLLQLGDSLRLETSSLQVPFWFCQSCPSVTYTIWSFANPSRVNLGFEDNLLRSRLRSRRLHDSSD